MLIVVERRETFHYYYPMGVHPPGDLTVTIERHGYPVTYLSPDSEGTVAPEQLSAVITDRTRLVSIMFSNNEIGTIEPIA